MRVRAAAPLLALLALGAAPPLDPATRLTAAKARSAAAQRRADRLDRAVATAIGAAARARAVQAALAARIVATQADVAAAEARVVLVAAQVAAQRGRLAAEQQPAARLLAALQSLASRPTAAALAQPGSVDDLVHVRAALGAALPVVRARSAEVRAALDRSRALEQAAALAVRTLRTGRAQLEQQRLAQARLASRARLRGTGPGRDALRESDQALALGERVRDIVATLSAAQDAGAVTARLATLPGPLLRPDPATTVAAGAASYRLPVAGGRLVTGLGEIAVTGVHSRGLTLAVAPGAVVRSPAAGVVRYAARFREYGVVVVVDHGGGWTSTLTGLGRAAPAVGRLVAAGAVLGRAPGGDEPRITVELRRRGRPIDAAALIGAG